MKKYLFFILAMTVSVTAFSQNFKENRKKADRIKADDAYYFGESGECKNSRKADEEALNELLENIAMDKSLHPLYFQNSDDEDEQHERILGTFSEVLKKQSDDLVLDDANGSAKAFRYIKKSVFAELCKVRESKIKGGKRSGSQLLQMAAAPHRKYSRRRDGHSSETGKRRQQRVYLQILLPRKRYRRS